MGVQPLAVVYSDQHTAVKFSCIVEEYLCSYHK